MKTKIFLVLILLSALSFQAPLHAEEEKEMGRMDGEGREHKGMMGMKMMGMHKMMERSVVATSDGGIVVVAGNKITKYDKDLNLVKEVETKMDMEAMEKKMKEMMKKHQAMESQEKSSDATENASEHAAHHAEPAETIAPVDMPQSAGSSN